MSTHLLIAAMYLEDLPQGRKLILAAIADSADEHTLEAAPGLPKLRAWSSLSKSAALAQVKALEDDKLIERVEAGRLGRRAVYRVFPTGVPDIPHPSVVAARYDPTTLTEPVDNSHGEGPAGRTLGSCLGSPRVLPTGPLHTNPSVSRRDAALHTPHSGDNRRPAPPASGGFPGSRQTHEDAQGIARRAKGAADQPCPRHPAEIVPCGRCAHAAATSDPAKIASAAAEARRLIATAKITTTTEETHP